MLNVTASIQKPLRNPRRVSVEARAGVIKGRRAPFEASAMMVAVSPVTTRSKGTGVEGGHADGRELVAQT